MRLGGDAEVRVQAHGNKKLTAEESRDAINQYYGGNKLATAPAEQPNKLPAS